MNSIYTSTPEGRKRKKSKERRRKNTNRVEERNTEKDERVEIGGQEVTTKRVYTGTPVRKSRRRSC
jgi:hypothetical protein